MSQDIIFSFDPVKTTQAAALLLKLHGQPAMSYLGLLKMLYISDRRSLAQNGYPITGDSFVSMKYGPVLSKIYDFVKPNGGFASSDYWADHIATVAHRRKPNKRVFVALTADPGDDDLSISDDEILAGVYKDFGDIDPFDVAEWTHSLPEWTNPEPLGKKVVPIAVEQLLGDIGMDAETIQHIREIAQRERHLDGVLNG